MVLMRRFHLTPGQPEYVFIKRRVSVNDADQLPSRGIAMPRGDKSKYTEKQKRKAEHIEQGYEQQGIPEPEAEKRAWATVNKIDGGGKRSGSGRGKPVNKAPARKGGKKGGAASAARSAEAKSESARKAARTRSTLRTRLRPSATS
jgi:plasmid stabilization system protein ParE